MPCSFQCLSSRGRQSMLKVRKQAQWKQDRVWCLDFPVACTQYTGFLSWVVLDDQSSPLTVDSGWLKQTFILKLGLQFQHAISVFWICLHLFFVGKDRVFLSLLYSLTENYVHCVQKYLQRLTNCKGPHWKCLSGLLCCGWVHHSQQPSTHTHSCSPYPCPEGQERE